MTVGELFILGYLVGAGAFGVGMGLGLVSAIRRKQASRRAARLRLVGLAAIAATPGGAMLLGTDRNLPDLVWMLLVLVSLSFAAVFLLIAFGLRVGGGRGS